MRLGILRHADAVRVGGLVRDDTDRPLSPFGREQARRSGELMHSAGIRFKHLFTSPLMRAVQTAEIIASTLSHGGPVESLPMLGRHDAWRTELDGLLGDVASGTEKPAILLVGHNPDLSEIAAAVLGLSPAAVQLETACGCIVELSAARITSVGTLIGFVDPSTTELRRHP
jgi:phosphohistidine phosphatase